MAKAGKKYTETVSPAKEAVLGIDIGGTSIKWAVYERINGVLSEEPAVGLADSIKTKPEGAAFPTLEQHVKDVTGLVDTALAAAKQKKLNIVSAGIASPGKFIDDGKGGKKIERGSSPNMGIEFDELNLQAAFEQGLKQRGIRLPITVINDASAQQMGIVEALLKQEGASRFKDSTVGYIGLGTGLGGGFMTVDRQGNTASITDGHLSDVMIKLSDSDAATVKETNTLLEELIVDKCKKGDEITPDDTSFTLNAEGNRIKGDDILSAKAVNRFTGFPPRYFNDAPGIISTYADRLGVIPHSIAQLIKQVRDKDITKQHDYQNWSDADKEAASKTSVWVLSGGMMENSVLGPFIMNQTEASLKQLGVEGITLVRNEVKQAAERAAAASAPVAEKVRGAAVS